MVSFPIEGDFDFSVPRLLPPPNPTPFSSSYLPRPPSFPFEKERGSSGSAAILITFAAPWRLRPPALASAARRSVRLYCPPPPLSPRHKTSPTPPIKKFVRHLSFYPTFWRPFFLFLPPLFRHSVRPSRPPRSSHSQKDRFSGDDCSKTQNNSSRAILSPEVIV